MQVLVSRRHLKQELMLLFPAGFLAAFPSTFPRGRFAALLSTTRAALFAALVRFVHGCPGASRRFLFADAALFVSARDLLRLAFLFSRIFLFASLCHCLNSSGLRHKTRFFSKIREPGREWICPMI